MKELEFTIDNTIKHSQLKYLSYNLSKKIESQIILINKLWRRKE